MLTVMALIRASADLTDEVISSALEHPDVKKAGKSILGRVFNAVTDRSQKGIQYARGTYELDAITQFFFADVSSSLAAAGEQSMNLSMGLPPARLDDVQPMLCLQNQVISPPRPGVGLKRMSILRKRPDVSSEDFQDQWFNMHAVLVKRLPGILGYRQNLVIDGPRDADGHALADGVVELWFPDGAAIDLAFQSTIGSTTMMHAKEFIDEITTFLVKPTAVSGRF